MKVIIFGSGKPVYFLCKAFQSKGYDVTIIDQDQDECVRLARRTTATVIHGDGTEAVILREAGAHAAAAVLALTPNDQDNLAACQLAKLQFDVPRAVALANDPDNERIFQKLGIAAFSTTQTIASMVEQRTDLEEITNLIPAGEGKVNITEIKLKPDAPVIDSSLSDFPFPPDTLVAVIIRHDEALIPNGDTVIQRGDRLVLITLPANHGAAIKRITGDPA